MAAIRGMGICQLPEFYVRRAIECGDLVPLLRSSAVQGEPVWAIFPERKHLLPKVRLLIDRLRSELTPALAAGEGTN